MGNMRFSMRKLEIFYGKMGDYVGKWEIIWDVLWENSPRNTVTYERSPDLRDDPPSHVTPYHQFSWKKLTPESPKKIKNCF